MRSLKWNTISSRRGSTREWDRGEVGDELMEVGIMVGIMWLDGDH